MTPAILLKTRLKWLSSQKPTVTAIVAPRAPDASSSFARVAHVGAA
ncbi:Hypothetical protein A7982_01220 [Minicystis rosea]|nr:Hypothetical protein A7982_01220 [Minicystis rosea]